MRAPTAAELIEAYGLEPHPEGGYFKETYRSEQKISALQGERSCSTAIYFLLPRGAKSRLHRIKSDEIWHFHLGGPLTLMQICPSGRSRSVVMGPDVRKGQLLQHVVPAGYWFGAYPEGDYSFVGCTVAPGFDFADFQLGEREDLLSRFPAAGDVVERLA